MKNTFPSSKFHFTEFTLTSTHSWSNFYIFIEYIFVTFHDCFTINFMIFMNKRCFRIMASSESEDDLFDSESLLENQISNEVSR